MVSVTDSNLVSEAIVIWTGWGRAPWPDRDEQRLVKRFGEAAVDLVPVVKSLEDDFYESDARDLAADVAEMGDMASNDFRTRHPELSEEAVRALAWCYTYDYK